MPKRSPIIFWLLLAATLCVDAVVVVWVMESGADAAEILGWSLAFSQLGITCVWAIVCQPRVGWKWLVPIGLALAVAGTAVFIERRITILSSAGIREIVETTSVLWLYVLITIGVLWLLKPTRVFKSYQATSTAPPWQFGLRHLILLMTLTPILLIAASVGGDYGDTLLDPYLLFCLGLSSLLLISAILVVQRPWHWVLKAGALSSCALAISVTSIIPNPFSNELMLVTIPFHLILALVYWPWLEVLRPASATNGANGNERASPQKPPA